MSDLAVPRRVQLSRAKGYRMPPHTKSVARPSRLGNPYRVGDLVTVIVCHVDVVLEMAARDW